jgi:type II secretory pathway pseudopilin PulG
MFFQCPRGTARAFALVELVVVVLILLAVLVAAALLLPDARRRAMLAGSIQNLKQLGAASAGFAADNNNRVFALSWTPGEHTCGDYAFPTATTYNDADADQAVCILREQAGRTDITAIRGWVPQPMYTTLVLSEYLDDSLPSSKMVSPGDAPRLAWMRAVIDNPEDPSAAYFDLACRPAGADNSSKRWPYSSSYEISTSFVSPDALVSTPQGQIPTISQDVFGHRWYQVGNARTVLGDRRMDEVLYPSNKAMLYEANQRFFGPSEPFFMYGQARVPVLFPEGSVSVRSVNTCNPGFQPNLPQSPAPTRVNYVPESSWETPPLNGGTSEFIDGHTRWTRSGLRGRDFTGPEVPWSP